jgi:uncharacterized protein YjbI with pentapeptide repeats
MRSYHEDAVKIANLLMSDARFCAKDRWRMIKVSGARVALAVLALSAGCLTAVAAVPGAARAATCPTVSAAGDVSPAPAPGVDWDGCNLANAVLTDANLAGANLAGATMTNDLMTRANLSNANLAGASMVNASGNPDLAGADLNGATLTDDLFNGANLAGADLTNLSGFGLHLLDASLRGAILSTADVEYADLTLADLTGATGLDTANVTGVTWTHTICPNGVSADNYTGGCLGTPNVTVPTASPVVTGGTAGTNGWYTSNVTVSWNWVDSSPLTTGTAACPASSTSAGQGAAIQITATCTDSDGNTGTATFTAKIDWTPPTETVVGAKNGAIYALHSFPLSHCADSDAVSGVAVHSIDSLYAPVIPGTSTIGLAGVYRETCAGATDNAGNVAGTVTVRYTVTYLFGGFITPKVGSTFSHTAKTITVRTFLSDEYGKGMPAAEQAARAKYHEIRATLAGPGIKPVTITCGWNATVKSLQCVLPVPRTVMTGHSHKYTITVYENLGGGWIKIPADSASENPGPFYFK